MKNLIFNLMFVCFGKTVDVTFNGNQVELGALILTLKPSLLKRYRIVCAGIDWTESPIFIPERASIV